ncbi:hypothetical protein J2S13_001594 [Oikeobacillus pervagus]|uniref:Uncharacterized protein n=1 Tax=Oikeobacillus pervagus TaxID=1325931 RepID=A0AAJ1SYK9_9BACI|nr:hypothetical protein [Oikeobacillus pervagus]
MYVLFLVHLYMKKDTFCSCAFLKNIIFSGYKISAANWAKPERSPFINLMWPATF